MKKDSLKFYGKIPPKKSIIKRAFISALVVTMLFVTSSCSSKKKYEDAVILNNGNSISMPLSDWEDSYGEEMRLVTIDGMGIITSSYFASIVSSEYSFDFALKYAKNLTDKEGFFSKYSNLDYKNSSRDIGDSEYNKAIIIKNNRAVIIPILKWKNYTGEQMQITTPENVTILLSNYNTMLVADSKSATKAIDLAHMLVGKKGTITDFATNYNDSSTKPLFDTKNNFNKAIILGDTSNCILPLSSWKDYSDGEQIQLKISNGLTYLSSTFSVLLVDDTNGAQITALKISEELNEKTIDLAEDYVVNGWFPNKQWFDFDENFQNGIISNGDLSTILPIKNWDDHSGERLKFTLNTGVTILTSSVDSSMSSYSENRINVDMIAGSITPNIFNLDEYYVNRVNNKEFNLFDSEGRYPYALIINDKSILILSIENWYEYPGGEQVELELTNKLAKLLTTYHDTKLVNLGNSNLSIYDVASWFNSGDKNIIDLTSREVGSGTYDNALFRGKANFNYAIAINNDTALIMPIDGYEDLDGNKNSDGDYTSYSDQIKITLNDNNGIHFDSNSIKLIETNDREFLEQIAHGYLSNTGTVNELYGKTKVINK